MSRIDHLRARMQSEQVDLVALGPGAHLAWLLGVRPHGDERPLLYVVTQMGAGFLMPALEADSARQHTDEPFFCWSDDKGPERAFSQLMAEIGGTEARAIALDETMRADFAALVQDALPQASRQFSASTVGALRMRKDAGEYGKLKTAALMNDRAMLATWAAMRPGMTEREVANIARDHFKSEGAVPMFTIVGAGGNGAFPHHQTGDTKLDAGQAVVMDIGGGLDGFPSDMTRMAFIGAPSDDYLKVHQVVENAVQAALAAAKPGAKAHEVDDAARSVITDAGYGAYFVHRTGHGLGVEIHEPPYITATSQEVLDEGMVFSIEPGIYLPGKFGIRLEDIVILRSDGPEILSDLPRDLCVIDG